MKIESSPPRVTRVLESKNVMSFAGCAAFGSCFVTITLRNFTGCPRISSNENVIRRKNTSILFPAVFSVPAAFRVPSAAMFTSPITQLLARASLNLCSIDPWFSKKPLAVSTGW
eukprot:1359076-Rhodomonas_salina.3